MAYACTSGSVTISKVMPVGANLIGKRQRLAGELEYAPTLMLAEIMALGARHGMRC